MSAEQNSGDWLRLSHRTLGMPLPAVYMPIDHLSGLDLHKLGFISVMNRDEKAPLPMSDRMAADVMSDPGKVSLMVFRKLPKSKKRILRLGPPEKIVAGQFDSPADESWQNEAYVAQAILLVAGPRPESAHTPVFQLLFNPESMLTGVTLVTVQ